MSQHARADSALRAVGLSCLGLFVVIAGFAIAKKTGLIDYDLAKRGVAMSLGVMLIVAGNFLPKLRLFDGPGRDPARVLWAERSAGWIFVLAGVAYVAVWAFTPIAHVMWLSSAVGLSAFAFVAMAWKRAAAGGVPWDMRSAGHGGESALVKRVLLFTVLLTLLWSVSIFLVDYIWGDAVTQVVAIGFPILLGVVLSVMLPLRLLRAGPASRN